jgi:hypothetical protein
MKVPGAVSVVVDHSGCCPVVNDIFRKVSLMRNLILILLTILSSQTFAFTGKGLGGKTIEIKGSGGYIPWAVFRIKNRDKNFFYTGTRYDVTGSYFTARNTNVGFYFTNMQLDNKQNTDETKEEIKVYGIGFNCTAALPVSIRPFAEFGAGFYFAEIDAEIADGTIVKQRYTQGWGGKLSLGLGPRIRGVGLYIKIDGEYIQYEKGYNRDNTDQKLMKSYQFNWAGSAGLQIAL